MKRVFYRCNAVMKFWTSGKDYEVFNGPQGDYIVDNDGDRRGLSANKGMLESKFIRIERDESEPAEPDLVIEVDDVITHREMLVMDAEPLKSTDNMGVSKPVVDEWIKRENEFTEKQQAKQEAEAQKEQAKAEQMAQAGEVFSREYGSLNDHRLGYRSCGV